MRPVTSKSEIVTQDRTGKRLATRLFVGALVAGVAMGALGPLIVGQMLRNPSVPFVGAVLVWSAAGLGAAIGIYVGRGSWTRAMVFALATGALTWIATAAGWIAIDSSKFRLLAYGCEAFDQAAWRAAKTEPGGSNRRSKMIARLLLSGSLDKRPRQEVLDLLGSSDCSSPGTQTEAWEIGFVSGFQIDVDCLHVWYGADGKVQRYSVIQH